VFGKSGKLLTCFLDGWISAGPSSPPPTVDPFLSTLLFRCSGEVSNGLTVDGEEENKAELTRCGVCDGVIVVEFGVAVLRDFAGSTRREPSLALLYGLSVRSEWRRSEFLPSIFNIL